MQVALENNNLRVEISTKGAELQSIKTVNDAHEYLWQGNDNSWKRKSPILFPHVGAINNDTYTYQGKQYLLSQHGFARDMEFDIVEKTTNSVIFSITDTEQTLRIFPFSFHLQLGYTLIGNSLKISYKVINQDNKTMLFSIGAHPGFNCPIEKQLNFSDYKLTFNEPEYSKRILKKDPVLSGERENYFTGNQEIALEYNLFNQGALIFDDLKSNKVTLESTKGTKKVIMDFSGFPYMGIWSWPKKPAPFICLEPWFGIDSTIGDTAEWEKKAGIIPLKEGGIFNSFYTLDLV